MRISKQFLLGVLCMAAPMSIFSHALFVQTEAQGKIGKTQAVTVFYAEPYDGLQEEIGNWWSDTASFTLWLIKPDGSKEQLKTLAQNNHYSAEFTPSDHGVYILSASHNVKDLAGDTQYQFNTSAMVYVLKKGEAGTPKLKEELVLLSRSGQNAKKMASVSFLLLKNGSPVPESYVTIFSPKGWRTEVKTNEQGVATFVPEWSGRYLLEGSQENEVENQPYKKLHQIVTTVFHID